MILGTHYNTLVCTWNILSRFLSKPGPSPAVCCNIRLNKPGLGPSGPIGTHLHLSCPSKLWNKLHIFRDKVESEVINVYLLLSRCNFLLSISVICFPSISSSSLLSFLSLHLPLFHIPCPQAFGSIYTMGLP